MLGLIIFYILVEIFLFFLAIWIIFAISSVKPFTDVVFGLTPNWFNNNFKIDKFLSWIIVILLFPIFHLYYIICLIIWLINLRRS